MKTKIAKRMMKIATATIDVLMEKHCSIKRTPAIIVAFMSPEKYALHIQRKFSALAEWQKKAMVDIGKQLEKSAKRENLRDKIHMN